MYEIYIGRFLCLCYRKSLCVPCFLYCHLPEKQKKSSIVTAQREDYWRKEKGGQKPAANSPNCARSRPRRNPLLGCLLPVRPAPASAPVHTLHGHRERCCFVQPNFPLPSLKNRGWERKSQQSTQSMPSTLNKRPTSWQTCSIPGQTTEGRRSRFSELTGNSLWYTDHGKLLDCREWAGKGNENKVISNGLYYLQGISSSRASLNRSAW